MASKTVCSLRYINQIMSMPVDRDSIVWSSIVYSTAELVGVGFLVVRKSLGTRAISTVDIQSALMIREAF